MESVVFDLFIFNKLVHLLVYDLCVGRGHGLAQTLQQQACTVKHAYDYTYSYFIVYCFVLRIDVIIKLVAVFCVGYPVVEYQ